VFDKASGDTYYYDPNTKKTTWDLPENALIDHGNGVIAPAHGGEATANTSAAAVAARPRHANSMFSLKNGQAAAAAAAPSAYAGAANAANAANAAASLSLSHHAAADASAMAGDGRNLSVRNARQMGKHFAGGNLSGLAGNGSMRVVDQRSNIVNTTQVHHQAEKQRKIAEALVSGGNDDGKQSYGMVWNRQTGEFSKALRIGQRSKSKHQIHSLAAQALDLRRREQMAGQLPAKKKRHARHKYGF
jgi:hypothetical protein